MKVVILVTVPRPELLMNCTLVFSSLRIGFPTWQVTVWDNDNTAAVSKYLQKVCKLVGAEYTRTPIIHHAQWIENQLNSHTKPFVIIDPDTLWWHECESLNFDSLYAGYYTPLIWNEFAQCISAPRIHTSFMWFNNPQRLMSAIEERYPNANNRWGEYCPTNPFMPSVKFINGAAMFWDTCANMYNMVKAQHFTQNELLRYDHVPSSAFFDVMKERVCDPQGFERLHEVARSHSNKLQNMWPGVKDYYDKMNKIALDCLKQNPLCLT